MARPSTAPALTVAARRARIRAALAADGFLRVASLADELGVSAVTLRADLAALERDGVLVRVHGGAMPRTVVAEDPVETASVRDAELKRAIGRAAAALVTSGSSVALDVGSTALAVAHALVARADLRDVTIVTNGLGIALALEPGIPRFTVVVTGGTLRPLQHSLVAPLAANTLPDLHLDLAILGCNGIADDGEVTNLVLAEAEVKRALRGAATRSVLVAEGGKVGVRRLASIGTLADFDVVVTAGDGAERLVEPCASAGVELVVAT